MADEDLVSLGVTPAPVGGEMPIADNRAIFQRMPVAIRERFAAGILYAQLRRLRCALAEGVSAPIGSKTSRHSAGARIERRYNQVRSGQDDTATLSGHRASSPSRRRVGLGSIRGMSVGLWS